MSFLKTYFGIYFLSYDNAFTTLLFSLSSYTSFNTYIENHLPIYTDWGRWTNDFESCKF